MCKEKSNNQIVHSKKSPKFDEASNSPKDSNLKSENEGSTSKNLKQIQTNDIH